jgi:hypothetical protein
MFKDNKNTFIRNIMEYKPKEIIRFEKIDDCTMMYFINANQRFPIYPENTWTQLKKTIDMKLDGRSYCIICEDIDVGVYLCPQCCNMTCLPCIQKIMTVNQKNFERTDASCPICRYSFLKDGVFR